MCINLKILANQEWLNDKHFSTCRQSSSQAHMWAWISYQFISCHFRSSLKYFCRVLFLRNRRFFREILKQHSILTDDCMRVMGIPSSAIYEINNNSVYATSERRRRKCQQPSTSILNRFKYDYTHIYEMMMAYEGFFSILDS